VDVLQPVRHLNEHIETLALKLWAVRFNQEVEPDAIDQLHDETLLAIRIDTEFEGADNILVPQRNANQPFGRAVQPEESCLKPVGLFLVQDFQANDDAQPLVSCPPDLRHASLTCPAEKLEAFRHVDAR